MTSNFDLSSKHYWIVLSILCIAYMIIVVSCNLWVSNVYDAFECGIILYLLIPIGIPVALFGFVIVLFELRKEEKEPLQHKALSISRVVFGILLISFSIAFETLWQIDPVTFAILFAAGLLILIDAFLQTRQMNTK